MASDWIILGAIAVLAVVVFLFVKSLFDEARTDPEPRRPRPPRKPRSKDAPLGH